MEDKVTDFTLSRDKHWYWCKYITIDPEEYAQLKVLASEWDVSEKIAAGVLLRKALRNWMKTEDYVTIYKKRIGKGED